jgi:chemotaxis signal transduction protein
MKNPKGLGSFPDTYLTFCLGERILAFEADSLWEISTSASISHIPRTASFLVGVTHFHGKVIPVIDLPGLLDLKIPTEEPRITFIALQDPSSGHLGGFYVTRVLGFERFGRFIRSPKRSRPFVTGEVERTQGSCWVLDLNGLWKAIRSTPLALQTIG